VRTALALIKGVSIYSPGKHVSEEHLDKESPDAYEKRTWRERAHYDDKGIAFIPPMCFKKALDTAAARLGDKIKGRRNQTWTKYFLSGVMVVDPLTLGVKREDVKGQWLFVPSDGKKGGSTRVDRCFPVFEKWGGQLPFLVLDDLITEAVFERTLEQAGAFVGVGTFRPERGGYFGRFEIPKVTWK